MPRPPHRLALALVGLVLLAACGEEGTPTAPPRAGPPEFTGEGPLPVEPPDVPGVDPAARRAYEEAPVPAPVPFGTSKLRLRAEAEGLFEGLPPADPEEVDSLLEALLEAKVAAEHRPGTHTGGPAGPDYEPSREELRAAELAERLAAAIVRAPAEAVRQAWADVGLGTAPVEVTTFEIVSTKVFGSGFMDTVEVRTRTISPP
jgi:hypothetical protein